MSIDAFFVRTVTIQHPVLVPSGYGDGMEEDFTTPTTTVVKGWLHQLSESEQVSSTRDADVSTHVLRLPAGTAIDSGDRVVVDGQTFLVDGPVAKHWRPNGEHHRRVPLRYIDG